MDDSSSPGTGTTSGNGEQTLVTKEGLRKLKEELQHLRVARRREVAQRLKEAISYGDLSENSEYEEAKNEQAFVEGRILELEQKIKNAKLIAEGAHSKREKEVNMGSSVTIRNITADEEPETYTIVGATEADPFSQKISNESPIGKAILLKCCGDTVLVATPAGTAHYEILRVS
ncbi:transcription elongation factor GreA [Candidatus Peregrinibacteria bacterium]|nr:transcription elongation factor GreA [Candidatus Peregrinibacteria bacterium]MBI2523611.1 transcription elongation factor GreA [Candidatus Peregrinibacteria bacterium]